MHDRTAPSPLRPLGAALIGSLVLALLGVLALGSGAAQRADAAALASFERLGLREKVAALAHDASDLGDPAPVVAATLLLVAAALLRGRPRTALAVAFTVFAANVTTQILKPALATPRVSQLLGADQVPSGSWPSGHSTGAMAVALCAVLVAAPQWRSLVAIAGTALALAVGYAQLVLGAHFPSDVLGGYLVAAVWVLAGAAALRGANRRWPPRAGRAAVVRLHDALTPPLAAALAALCAGAAVLLLRPRRCSRQAPVTPGRSSRGLRWARWVSASPPLSRSPCAGSARPGD